MLALVLELRVDGFSLSSLAPLRIASQSQGPRTTNLEAGRTLYDKIFDDHVVTPMGGEEGNTVLMYIDRHLVHEVRKIL